MPEQALAGYIRWFHYCFSPRRNLRPGQFPPNGACPASSAGKSTNTTDETISRNRRNQSETDGA